MKNLTAVAAFIVVGCGTSEDRESFNSVREALSVCDDIEHDVLVGTQTYTVRGTLCRDEDLDGEQTVLVLTSGGTYSNVYWDFPFRPNIYSFSKRANNAGYATLNLDRIGIGTSDRPPADDVTLQAGIDTLEDVVEALSDGDIAGVEFPKIVVIGHSLSSPMGLALAGGTEVDAVVATSWLHLPGPGFLSGPATLWEASMDPAFSGSGIPSGYKTTVPGTRGQFYWLPETNPGVVEKDEDTKDCITQGEIDSFLATQGGGAVVPSTLAVPVLLMVGANDSTFCTPGMCVEAMLESDNYDPATQPDIVVVPDTGHDITLHYNAPTVQADLLDWIDTNI